MQHAIQDLSPPVELRNPVGIVESHGKMYDVETLKDYLRVQLRRKASEVIHGDIHRRFILFTAEEDGNDVKHKSRRCLRPLLRIERW